MTPLDYAVIALYLAGTMALGSWFSKGQTSLKEFFLGSRNIPWWAAAFSGVATMISGASYLGGPGQAFKADFTFLQYRLATPFAIAVVCLVLIPFFYRLNLYSAYEYLERRFDLKTRTLASVLFLLLKCFYMGIVIYAPSLIMAEMTGLPLTGIVLATGVLTTAYTMLGGMRAVIWTDTMQLVVLLGGLTFSAWLLAARIVGGLSGFLHAASDAGKLRFFDFSSSLVSEVTLWGGLVGGLFFMLSQYGVDQSELQRFLTTSSVRRSRMAVISAMLAGVAVGFLLFFIGAALFVFYSQNPAKGGLGINPDRAFPKFIIEELPSGVTGLVIAGVFAASMSTISAVLNSLTTVALSDLYHCFTARQATVAGARRVTFGFGLLCTLIALFAGRFGTILAATAKLTNFFGGTLVGVFLLGMLVNRANGWGAFLGALSGFGSVMVISFVTPVSWMWYGALSAIIAFASGALFSLLFAPPAGERIDGLTIRTPKRVALCG